MEKLPDYIIENNIIPFLNSEELFYKFRPLGSYYYHCARVKILIKFPDEIMKNLKKIIEYNAREDPTKNFQELIQRSMAEKRLVLILVIQANPSLQIHSILSNIRDDRALRLIAFFYVLIKDETRQSLIRQEKYDEIQQISNTENIINEINDKIKEGLSDDDLDFDINEFRLVYSSLDDEYLRNNEYTVHLFNFVTVYIQMLETKLRLNDVKNKLSNFLEQINETTEIWPKKKVFYEKTIELVADTQILATGAKNMLKLFKKYDIETDLDDFNYDKEIINENEIKGGDAVYSKIKNNRKKLNATVLRIHQMFAFFLKSINYDKINKKDDYIDIFSIKSFIVSGLIFPIDEFLYILSMIKKKFCINDTTFLLTRNYLYHNIYHVHYKINPAVSVKEYNKIDEKENDEDEIDYNKDINGTKYISLLNHNIGDGINNFESILESTEIAGKEINESFAQLTKNLENYSHRLHEANNNNDN
jgi:hypothetical protein